MWYDYYDYYGYNSNNISYAWLLIPAIILIGVGIWWINKKKSANDAAKPVEAGAPAVVPAPQAIPAVQPSST